MKISSLLQSLSAAALVSLPIVQASPVNFFKRDEFVASNVTNTTAAAPATSSDSFVSVTYGRFGAIYKPRVFIISMFSKEEKPWIEGLDMFMNVSIPGLSPEYPEIHCVSNYTICQVTTGEGEINAAATVAALTLSPLFDLSETYFMVSGIAGGSPEMVTLGSATFPKFAIQVGLAYEADSRQTPQNWTSGYASLGTDVPNEYPTTIYGTEIFELNSLLRDRAMKLLSNVSLSIGSDGNIAFRKLYGQDSPAFQPPQVVGCDTATSDVYWYGSTLAHTFENYTSIISNGSATYCSTQQEDNATLEAMMRMSKHGLVDYSRIVILRTISDFDRPPMSLENDTTGFFMDVYQGGSKVAITNLYAAGLPFVSDVVKNWDELYSFGYKTKNYLGDYFGTLGGKPDFGLPGTN